MVSSRQGDVRISLLDVGAFLTELAMLGALIYVGLALPIPFLGRVLAAIVLPLLLIVVWGRWLAPRAARPLPPSRGLGLKVAIFLLVSLLLAAVGSVGLAVAFFVVTEAVTVAAEVSRRRSR